MAPTDQERADALRQYRKARGARIQADPVLRARRNIQQWVRNLGESPYRQVRIRCRSPEAWCQRLWRSIRFRAVARGLPFNLSSEDIFDLIPIDYRCPVLGIPFSFGAKLCAGTPSVDRLVPELGYVRGNVAIISHRANRLKGNCTDPDELRRLADWVENSKAKQVAWRADLAAARPTIVSDFIARLREVKHYSANQEA